jgi:hypothetical protein
MKTTVITTKIPDEPISLCKKRKRYSPEQILVSRPIQRLVQVSRYRGSFSLLRGDVRLVGLVCS